MNVDKDVSILITKTSSVYSIVEMSIKY